VVIKSGNCIRFVGRGEVDSSSPSELCELW